MMNLRLVAPIVAVLALLPLQPLHAQGAACGPVLSRSGPDSDGYGKARGYPLGTPAQRNRQPFMVASYSRFAALFPVHAVQTGAEASPLKRSCAPLSVRYRHDGTARTLDDYLARHPVTGFLVARGDTILTERYQYGRVDTDLFTSQSMAKTVMAMLFGVAVNDGKISSLDDVASRYVPSLKDTAYGETRLRDLLRMGSGVAFSEDYLGRDDNTKLNVASRRGDSPGMAALLAQYAAREAPSGSRFHYASSESMVLGLVLIAATGRSLAEYASEKLWRHIGAEADASWGTDPKGIETGSCCFNARLRDYARLALMLARDGGGVIPENWIREATTAGTESPFAPRRATPFYGYGYQTWLFPGPRRMFALLGVHGQAIFVDPQSKLVLVHTAVRIKASQDPQARELVSLWMALVRDYGKT